MTAQPPSYRGYRSPPEIISHAVWVYHRFDLSFRDVEDLLAERGVTVTYESIRLSLPETRYPRCSRCSYTARLIRSAPSMTALLVALLAAVRPSLRSRREPAAEILALRHQLAVLQRQGPRRPRLEWTDRRLRVLLSRLWPNWRHAVQIVQPATVVRWHRRGWRLYWRWKSRLRRPGRSPHPASRACAHPPDVPGQFDLGRYLVRRRRPPSLTWRTFLRNHVGQLASVPFFVVPTPTCRVLFVFVVLAHERRQIVHVNVTEHPTAAWTAQ